MRTVFGSRWVAVGALALAAVVLAGCEQFAPRVCFDCMSIQRPGVDTTDYMVACHVENNNDHPMRIEEIRWALNSGGKEIICGCVVKEIELQPRKSSPLDIYIQLPYRLLEKAGLAGRQQFDYELAGSVRFAGPLGGSESKFTANGRLPVIHPLKVELANVETSGQTESRVGLVLNVTVSNPNDIPLLPSQFTGQLLIKERPLVVLNKEPIVTSPVPPRESARVPIRVWVSSPEIGVKSLAKLLAAPDTRFRLIGEMQFRVSGTGDVEELFVRTPVASSEEQR